MKKSNMLFIALFSMLVATVPAYGMENPNGDDRSRSESSLINEDFGLQSGEDIDVLAIQKDDIAHKAYKFKYEPTKSRRTPDLSTKKTRRTTGNTEEQSNTILPEGKSGLTSKYNLPEGKTKNIRYIKFDEQEDKK